MMLLSKRTYSKLKIDDTPLNEIMAFCRFGLLALAILIQCNAEMPMSSGRLVASLIAAFLVWEAFCLIGGCGCGSGFGLRPTVPRSNTTWQCSQGGVPPHWSTNGPAHSEPGRYSQAGSNPSPKQAGGMGALPLSAP